MRILHELNDEDIEENGSRRSHDYEDTEISSQKVTLNSLASRTKNLLSSTKFWAISLVIAAIFLLVLLNKPEAPVEQTRIRWDSTPFNTTKALFITMKPHDEEVLANIDVLRSAVGFSGAEVFEAVNGKKVDRESLPLYTRYLMEEGRHDHHQVSTPGMVGCYLSHVRAMESMRPGDVFAIFEEDARFNQLGALQLKQLHDFVSVTGLQYSAIMIGINRVPAPSGDTFVLPVADDLNLVGCTKDCTMWGTRGYILTYEGAQKILEHAYPIQTQIDALMSLVARYDPTFKLFWTDQDIALGPPLLAIVKDINYSQVQDHCLKCHLPSNNMFYIVAMIALILMLGGCYCYVMHGFRIGRSKMSFSADTTGANSGPASRELREPSAPATLACVSPRGEANVCAVLLPKVDERHDVQAQSSAVVSQVLPSGVSMQKCHRRTGSRDGEATFLSTLSGEQQLQTLHFACHRRTGSGRELANVVEEAAVAAAEAACAVSAV